MARKPRILVAGTSQAIDTLERVLGGQAELVVALSTEGALKQLDTSIDLVVCNVRFDESRMFDFLQALLKSSRGREVPILCCRTSEAPLPPATRKAIVVALRALGIHDFVDCAPIFMEQGAEAVKQRLRDAVFAKMATRTSAR